MHDAQLKWGLLTWMRQLGLHVECRGSWDRSARFRHWSDQSHCDEQYQRQGMVEGHEWNTMPQRWLLRCRANHPYKNHSQHCTETKITNLLFFSRIRMNIFNFSCVSSVAKALSLFWWNFVETFDEVTATSNGLIGKFWNWSFPRSREARNILY